ATLKWKGSNRLRHGYGESCRSASRVRRKVRAPPLLPRPGLESPPAIAEALMSADHPDDTRTRDADFAAMWSSDGATRSLSPTASPATLPTDLPFLFSPGHPFW